MPVSKKKRKDGRVVRRKAPPAAPAATAEGPAVPEAKPPAFRQQTGKPTNPFVAQQQARRGSQRGQ
jgi:hypothetical protein